MTDEWIDGVYVSLLLLFIRIPTYWGVQYDINYVRSLIHQNWRWFYIKKNDYSYGHRIDTSHTYTMKKNINGILMSSIYDSMITLINCLAIK